MASRDEVLVAIINNHLDLAIAREKHWYRVPVSSKEKWLKDRWPPKWLALYQTKKFGDEAYAINYFAEVREVRRAYRWQLFPGQPHDDKSMPTPKKRRRIISAIMIWRVLGGNSFVSPPIKFKSRWRSIASRRS